MTRSGAVSLLLLAIAGALVVALYFVRLDYAPLPSEVFLENPDRYDIAAVYDVLGRKIDRDDYSNLARTDEGRRLLSPAAGAVKIDAALIAAGREAFYRETFGNEVFLTDVMGLLDGALTPWAVTRAVLALGGRGTSNLKVRLARPITIAGRSYVAGEEISTGLDVPRGGFWPLGLKASVERGRIRVGVTCAVCHTAVDEGSGRIVEGAPNTDFNVGLLLALSSNSAAYFAHTTMPSLAPFQTDPSRVVIVAGREERLPEPQAFERAVDAMFAAWPPGNFDATPDLLTNPTSIPDSFTAEGHPFGWTGFAAIGPFRGLTTLNNNVHALNSDETALAASAPIFMRLDPELYLGVLLQQAPNPDFRYEPGGPKPSEILARADPTPNSPGLNTYAVLPDFPKPNFFTTNGLIATRPGEPVGRALNAMSAFQNQLKPPPSPSLADVEKGRLVFGKAGCAACHNGPALTNHTVLPAADLGVEPARAPALAATENHLAPARMFSPGTPYPPPPDARLVEIPIDRGKAEALRLAWALRGSGGGYKVKGLIGLAWSAPYLHDGGVAVGPDATRDLGLPGTFDRGILPDPANSLRALVDRRLREKVVAANRASERARTAHSTGQGHAFHVDAEAGFALDEQTALINYLLSLTSLQR